MRKAPFQSYMEDLTGQAPEHGGLRLNAVVRNFLLDRVPEFVQLEEVKKKGWESSAGDAYFKKQRKTADEADDGLQMRFFSMMRQIGHEMDDSTGFLSCLGADSSSARVLDLCMAPGGFSSAVRQRHQTAEISGISLPPSLGGHPLLLDAAEPGIRASFTDITMLASEMGTAIIPPDHPDAANFSQDHPYAGESFDLVICDGQVLRMHSRQSYRAELESSRLKVSQLVLALQRIKPGGTLVMLLHKVDAWDSVELLHTFSKFSDIQLFKPARHHAMRSSFYLVATKVQPHVPSATCAVECWKRAWSLATFSFRRVDAPSEEEALSVLAAFGETFIRLGKPIWRIQFEALRKSSFIKNGKGQKGRY